MSLNHFRNTVEWALLVALVFGAGAIAQAQDEEGPSAGRIVRIGPGGDEQAAPTGQVERVPAVRTPGLGEQPMMPGRPQVATHWVGILGGPVGPELRAQLDIAAGQGVLVRQVVPDSPAAEAGLKTFDILLRANDVDLHELGDLTELVRIEGERQGQITLEVLRHGKRETVWVTPAERPEAVAQDYLAPGEGRPGGPGGFGWGGAMRGAPGDWFEFFHPNAGEEGRGRPGAFEFRRFGPGAIVGRQQFNLGQLPNGVSVSIHKQNDQPAQITVERGGEKWEIVGNDPESLKQLPDDLRPFVEQMLADAPLQMPFPNIVVPQVALPPDGRLGGRLRALNDQELRERLEAMERHMRELEERLFGSGSADQQDQQQSEQ